MSINPLTIKQLKEQAPALFTEQPHHEVSDMYHFIPTIDVVQEIKAHNWHPVSVSQAGVRDEDKQGTQQHLVRFRHFDDLLNPQENAVELCDYLGIDMKDVHSFTKVIENFNSFRTTKDFTNYYFTMTLEKLDNAFDRLIEFYINKKEIYTVDEVNKIKFNNSDKDTIIGRSFKKVDDIIKENISDYLIPAKYNFKNPTYKEKFSPLDKKIPLVALEQDFLLSINDLIPNRIKGTIGFNFTTRPLLRFKEMPIVDVPLNLNLSVDELTALVRKLKNDFENGIVKNSVNILYDTKFEFKNLKYITPFKMTKRSMSEAFFIYDLYNYIEGAMKLHKKKLKELKNTDIKEIKKLMLIKIEEEHDEMNKDFEERKNKGEKLSQWLIKNIKDTFKEKKIELERKQREKVKEVSNQYKMYNKDYHPMRVLVEIAKSLNICVSNI